MNYNALAEFSLNYGFFLACFIIVFGLSVVLLSYWFWFLCLKDVFKRSPEEFHDRTLWITILLVTLFIPGFIWSLIASVIYYLIYKPDLFNNKSK